MDYKPLNYRNLNIAENTFMPNTVKSYNNRTFNYWARSLFQRACSTIIFDKIPEAWEGAPKDFLYYCLFRYGFVAVFDLPEYGITFNPCTLSGYNIYYQFTNAIISNPAIEKGLNLEIDKECALLRLTPDYMGIYDIIAYYAEKISTLDVALNTALINSKIGMVLAAKTRNAALGLQMALDKINRGEPAVILDKTIVDDAQTHEDPFQLIDRDVGRNYISDRLLNDFQTLINNFDTEIGIPTLPYQKRERMVTSEAESKIIDSTSRSVVWFDTLTASIDNIKKLYPDINLSAKLRYDPEEMKAGDNENGISENDFDRPNELL